MHCLWRSKWPMEAKGKTKMFITPPSRWVSAQVFGWDGEAHSYMDALWIYCAMDTCWITTFDQGRYKCAARGRVIALSVSMFVCLFSLFVFLFVCCLFVDTKCTVVTLQWINPHTRVTQRATKNRFALSVQIIKHNHTQILLFMVGPKASACFFTQSASSSSANSAQGKCFTEHFQ